MYTERLWTSSRLPQTPVFHPLCAVEELRKQADIPKDGLMQ